MSYPPDPNNPYGQPQQPGYGYPQQAPPAAGYGYPQQAAQPMYGYPPAAPQRMSMPGLMVTARVFLFIIGAVQVIITAVLLLGAGGAKKVANEHTTGSETAIFGNAAASILLVIGVVYLLAAVLSITLGVKFGSGGPATRITTIVYGSVAVLLGLGVLISSITGGANSQVAGAAAGAGLGVAIGVLWIAISVLWIAAVTTRDGVAWFNRPRY
ncbi:hypothetical protein PUR71_15760 [Streptomyces sp. SP17BM10]|uniref:hypothetical protein n=1 Tax=Streptomyces sp. SP17BM10 TaxID=3002530 RepID=UPI002E7A202B|nr:hypothetical protein [Streptomyces sp. SP17BM10]MEE1784344.1 hypothetical protein [Streptomyces sp. SP17BM10]